MNRDLAIIGGALALLALFSRKAKADEPTVPLATARSGLAGLASTRAPAANGEVLETPVIVGSPASDSGYTSGMADPVGRAVTPPAPPPFILDAGGPPPPAPPYLRPPPPPQSIFDRPPVRRIITPPDKSVIDRPPVQDVWNPQDYPSYIAFLQTATSYVRGLTADQLRDNLAAGVDTGRVWTGLAWYDLATLRQVLTDWHADIDWPGFLAWCTQYRVEQAVEWLDTYQVTPQSLVAKWREWPWLYGLEINGHPVKWYMARIAEQWGQNTADRVWQLGGGD